MAGLSSALASRGSGLRPLVELVDDAVADERRGRWSIRKNGMWCVARPADHRRRAQGWKLHLSATPLSIGDLMERAVPVLVSERCAFKFPAGPDGISWLNSRSCPRGLAGKYVTVYPDDDDQFRRLAEALHRATAGLPGPEILSDWRYRPGSVVHYRFGGFTNSAVLDDDGRYRQMIVGPDGEMVEDRRDAWFAPPAWAPAVLPDQPPTRSVDGLEHVLLGDRFLVQKAIRHSSRGGVFQACDQRTGATVVVKQARAHMEVDPSGRDCRDRLRHETDLYARLAPTGLVSRVVGTVDEADHFFLVREMIEGTTLRQWVTRQIDAGGLSPEAGRTMAGALVRLVDAVHRAGLVLVDVSPNNMVVDVTGRLWLIDLDNAIETGQAVHPVGTPGYTPPEHRTGATVAARPEADLFGLGGLLFLMAVGTDPILADDDRSGRPVRARLRGWLAETQSDLPLAGSLAAPISGLMSRQPARRWRVEQVKRFLETPLAPASATCGWSIVAGVDRVIAEAVDWLRMEMTPDGSRLWPSGRFGADTDPYAVQHGAAGILAALVAAAPHATDPAPVREAIGLACRWIEKRLPAKPRLPGLYFGRSGTAWALHEAATLLGDQRLAAAALDLAARVPVCWANPDLAHGVAGAGLAQLNLWRVSGEQRFEPRVRACIDGLIAATSRVGTEVSWPIPPTLRSILAGQTHLGYAHGTAGIGAFLLAAGAATGDARGTRLACEAASTLADAAVLRDGAAFWPTQSGSDTLAGTGWCAGSAGIGTFLLRAWEVTGEPRLLDLARAAAVAVHRARGRSNPAACHGLVGGGHFLLDLAAALEEPLYRHWAEDLARLLLVRAVRRGGRLLVPDESGLAVVADFGVGLAGTLAFLTRLRHGGRSPWTVEPRDARVGGARSSTTLAGEEPS